MAFSLHNSTREQTTERRAERDHLTRYSVGQNHNGANFNSVSSIAAVDNLYLDSDKFGLQPQQNKQNSNNVVLGPDMGPMQADLRQAPALPPGLAPMQADLQQAPALQSAAVPSMKSGSGLQHFSISEDQGTGSGNSNLYPHHRISSIKQGEN